MALNVEFIRTSAALLCRKICFFFYLAMSQIVWSFGSTGSSRLKSTPVFMSSDCDYQTASKELQYLLVSLPYALFVYKNNHSQGKGQGLSMLSV